jgi:myxalamid-type polyketide synthase MxaE and MxaD
LLEGYISEHLARILHQDSTRVDRLATLGSLGVDSLMALELRNRLEASLGLRLSVATLFGYPTIAALAEHLLDKLNLANAAAEEVGKQASPLGEEGTRSTAEAAGAEIANVDDLLASIDRSLERVENLMKGQPGGRS